MDIKQKVIIKIQQNNINIFSNQILLGLIFVLVYLNRNNDVRYYLPKRIMKKFFDQEIYFDMKQSEEFRKSTTAQGVDYTTECLLDYYYIKTQHRLIAIDLRRQKELDADRKTIQKIAFVGQLKNPDYEIAANESVFVLTILQKFKETWLNFFKEVKQSCKR